MCRRRVAEPGTLGTEEGDAVIEKDEDEDRWVVGENW